MDLDGLKEETVDTIPEELFEEEKVEEEEFMIGLFELLLVFLVL